MKSRRRCATRYWPCAASRARALLKTAPSPASSTSIRRKACSRRRRTCGWPSPRGASKATTSRTCRHRWPAHPGQLLRRPAQRGYRRFRIRDVEGIDDYASIREVVVRRFRKLRDDGDIFPDVLLIDGGIGQLHAAASAGRIEGHRAPPGQSCEEGGDGLYAPALRRPAPPPPHAGPAPAAVRPRRSAPLRTTLPPHPAS